MRRLRALLANEAGGGRGHVTTLAAAARALGDDVDRIAAVGRLNYAQDLADSCPTVLKAPLLTRPKSLPRTFALRGSASFGDTLAEIGLGDPGKVARGLRFWRDLIVERDISILIADLAPLAQWAALGLRDEGWEILIVSIGTGYYTPPRNLAAFPVFLPDHDRILHPEADTLAVLNASGARAGLDALPRLAALYDVDLALATTFDFLDPYRAVRPARDRVAPLIPASSQMAGAGHGVFVYFSTQELADPALVDALAGLNLPRRGYLPSATPEVRARLLASGMELLDQPANPDAIAAYARLIVHAAPHGTLCLAALAGSPQFAIPRHLEQLYNARAAEACGILRHALPGDPTLGAQIAAAHADPGLARQAHDFALALRAAHPADPVAALRDRLRPGIDRVRAALP